MNSNSINLKQIRKFGLIALFFFGTLCALGVWKGELIPVILFGTLSFLGLGFIILPYRLKPVFDAWLKFAYLISKAVTFMLLTLAYYIVITPAGILKRLFGGMPLPVKPDKKASSYWVTREEPVQPKERFNKRY